MVQQRKEVIEMDIMERLRKARRMAWLLLSAITVPYLSVAAVAAPKVAATAPKSVVIFPMETAEGVANVQVASDLNILLRDALASSPKYQVVVYSERLPAVQRLVAMQPDKKGLTSGPFTPDAAGIEKAVTLGRAMSADLVLVGVVQKYSFNDKTGTVDITVSALLVDGNTGKTVQQLPIVGRGVGKAKTATEGVSEAVVQRDAVKDVVRKVMKAITGQDYQEAVQTATIVQKGGKKKSSLSVLLLAVGLGLLLGGSGGGSSPATTGGTDPPPIGPF
jgi:hypothetical protein